ncbi:MAG: hypothetical protein HIU86_06180 [Acidobacteria bacterium]|nr:hypothetical protein [Acidobacteriota bacterium]
MNDHRIHRAQQCPRPGCDGWALLATPEQVADEREPLWRWGAGHEGPRFLLETAAGDIAWSDRSPSATSGIVDLR